MHTLKTLTHSAAAPLGQQPTRPTRMTLPKNIPRPRHIRWGAVTLLGVPLLVLLLGAMLGMAAVQIQAAVRAYELSTNQTSRAQSQAVTALLRYARSHQEADWARYRAAMRLPESARQTRRLLLQYGPAGLPQVRQLMTEAGRHPDDVAAMLRLYHWFGERFVSTTTRDAWRQTDRSLSQLDQEAQRLRQIVQRDGAADEIDAILGRVDHLESSLQDASRTLATSWAHASRRTTSVLMLGIALSSILLMLGSALLIRRILRKQHLYTRSLSEARRRWELASSAAGLGLYQLDASTDMIQLDAAAAAMHGLVKQPTTIARSALRALILEEDTQRTRSEVDEVLKAGHDYRITYRVRLPDGQIRSLEACGRLIAAERGHNAGLIGVLRDVTDSVNQAELTLQREAAERVAQAQRAFLSRLSHELRTPLNAILGFAQLLQLDERPALTPPQRQQVHWILTAGQQLLALIEDVLDLSKVEAGEITLQIEHVDVNALLRDCLPLLDAARQQHQVTILNRSAMTPLWAQVDAQRLRQIAINLLSNACKYNRDQGHVTIDTREDGAEIVLDIGDDGIGMSAEDTAQIFHPFKRVASATSHAEGTGLGLYIVKQLAERMGGSVSVVSELGVGTRFSVRLPRPTEPVLDAQSSSSSSSSLS